MTLPNPSVHSNRKFAFRDRCSASAIDMGNLRGTPYNYFLSQHLALTALHLAHVMSFYICVFIFIVKFGRAFTLILITSIISERAEAERTRKYKLSTMNDKQIAEFMNSMID